MTREDDDLYARHQMLGALVNVLVHDLRNPLHSATLLLEAMGSPSADIGVLRGKLRAQIGKLDGLITETNDWMKEAALESCLEVIAVDSLSRAIAEGYPALTNRVATFVLPAPSGLEVTTDRRLLERAAIEVVAVLAEQHERHGTDSPPRVMVTIDEPEAGVVRLCLGDLDRDHGESLAKAAPFTIAGGGLRLAIARSLAQNAGATLRLEKGAEGTMRFALSLRKAG
jgi:signal transduction histidine kinase